MNKQLENFLAKEFKSKVRIIDAQTIEIMAPDGEVFEILCQVEKYSDKKTRDFLYHVIEAIFDKNYSYDKEVMLNNIWRDAIANAFPIRGMSSGNRQGERARIGERIRQIRTEKGIDARDLAKLAGIDAANLSRIENGKYSVGLDILSKIAASLGKKIDFNDI